MSQGSLVEVVTVAHASQRRRYPFSKLQPGDWFDAPVYEHDGSPARLRLSVANSATQYGKRSGKRFSVSCVNSGGVVAIRCWRVDGLAAKPIGADARVKVERFRWTRHLPVNAGDLIIPCVSREVAEQVLVHVKREIAERYEMGGWQINGPLWLCQIVDTDIVVWRAMDISHLPVARALFEELKRKHAVTSIAAPTPAGGDFDDEAF